MKLRQQYEESVRLTPPCLDYSYAISYMNTAEVRAAIHISPFAQDWDVCRWVGVVTQDWDVCRWAGVVAQDWDVCRWVGVVAQDCDVCRWVGVVAMDMYS